MTSAAVAGALDNTPNAAAAPIHRMADEIRFPSYFALITTRDLPRVPGR
jgi:hypothetical protein